MHTNLTIKNFRVFDEEGVNVNIAPLTILTGRNSAGKSSIGKAVTLLYSFLKQIKEDKTNGRCLDLPSYKLDFLQYPNNMLGGYDKVLHRGSTSENITFQYTTYSYMLSEEVCVELVFNLDKNDELKNGFLQKLEVRNLNGDVIYTSEKGEGSVANLTLIKEKALMFVRTKDIVCELERICGEVDSDVMSKPYEEIKKDIDSMNEILNQQTNKDDVLALHSKQQHWRKSECSEESINRALENGLLFNIPILDRLASIEKSHVEEILGKYWATEVISDFISSDARDFKEYFLKKEEEFLTNMQFGEEPIFGGYSFNTPAPWIPETRVIEDQLHFEVEGTSFPSVYSIVAHADSDYLKSECKCIEATPINDRFHIPFVYAEICKFLESFMQEVFMPEWMADVTFVGTSRFDIRRLYLLDNSDEFSKLLKSYLEAKRQYANYQETNRGAMNARKYVADSFMNCWIQQFGIGHSMSIHRDSAATSIEIRLFKDAEDTTGTILADEGHGLTQLLSMLLTIETAILQDSRGTIIIEEPEIHLHPQFQSMLAEMFAHAMKCGIHFIVETHSEYLIRKLQLLVADAKNDFHVDRNQVSILYVNDADVNNRPHGDPHVKQIGICKDGYLDDDFGSGFFDEAISLSRKLM